MPASLKAGQAWDGTLPREIQRLLSLHADYYVIPGHLAALDYFCLLMELHSHCTLSPKFLCEQAEVS